MAGGWCEAYEGGKRLLAPQQRGAGLGARVNRLARLPKLIAGTFGDRRLDQSALYWHKNCLGVSTDVK